MYFLYGVIGLVLILGGLVLAIIAHQSKASSMRKNQHLLNLEVNKMLKQKKFNITKTYYINDFATYNEEKSCKKQIHIDEKNKEICLIDYENNFAIIAKFNEILNYEIYENGGVTTTGGNLGGIGAGLFGAESRKDCKELRLIIRLKILDTPQITYNLISDTVFNLGYDKSSSKYTACISSLQEVVSLLEVIKHKNNSKKTNKNSD